MKRVIMPVTAAIIVVSIALYGDDDEKKRLYVPQMSKASKLYQTECGSCHMAYQPEFLPKRSWKKMIYTLDDHFKTDATLDKKESQQILAYLLKNANDSKPVFGDIGKMGKRIDSKTIPLRISEMPYFKKEHRKIPKRIIMQKEVRSIANCTACHTKADRGDYSERSLFVPNYGRWDD
jgi:nitrate/TMAO reductase-like tetraheme cytochrome c subunit